jgi:hypothetical protein
MPRCMSLWVGNAAGRLKRERTRTGSRPVNPARVTNESRHRPSVSLEGITALLMCTRGVTVALFRERWIAVW